MNLTDYPPVMTTQEAAQLLRKHENSMYVLAPLLLREGVAFKDGRYYKFWRDKLIKRIETKGLPSTAL